jgi:hypothetical protein
MPNGVETMLRIHLHQKAKSGKISKRFLTINPNNLMPWQNFYYLEIEIRLANLPSGLRRAVELLRVERMD